MVVRDGVFSMDGDLAPLPELVRPAHGTARCSIVDDAHGSACSARAAADRWTTSVSRPGDVPVLVGTLGKAFGTSAPSSPGTPISSRRSSSVARTYIYTTALPVAVAAATRAALEVCQWPSTWRRERVLAHTTFPAARRRAGWAAAPSPTPIQPVIIGGAEATRASASRRLLERGYLVAAIRPPTVPRHVAPSRRTLGGAPGRGRGGPIAAIAAGREMSFSA